MFLSSSVQGQTININTRFGKVSKDEVQLNHYDRDTSAKALMLFENTQIYLGINAGGQFFVSRKKHLRIKVLKEDGVKWGDFKMIHYHTPEEKEIISGIEVVTFNMEGDKVVESKMPRKYIFTEDYSEYYKQTSFSAQDVRVGSVIEVKYEITSDRFWEVDDVYFQRRIPVNLAECTIMIPQFFTFNKKVNGSLHVDYSVIEDSSSIPIPGTSYSYSLYTDKFKIADVPAFKVEPYVYNTSQYLSAVHYDIRSMNIPGIVTEDFSVAWPSVDENYLNSEMMRIFRGGCHFKDEIQTIPVDVSDEEKIAATVCLVKNKVQWDRSYKLFPESLGQAIKSRSGSNAEINCLVAGCLRELGFIVDPVLVKFRSSGHLLLFQPELHPYDTFILSVTSADGTVRYLDCGLSEGYINILDPEMLVENARLLRPEGRSKWVNLINIAKSGQIMNVTAALESDLTITGKMTANYFGEDSYSFKEDYNSYEKEEDFISDMENEHSIEIQEIEVKKAKMYSKDASVSIAYTEAPDNSADMIYINPFFSRFHSKDAFQSLTRDYPVDFPYPYSIRYTYTLTIPEGYAIEQIPGNILLKMEPLDASVKLLTKQMGNKLILSYLYTQNKNLGMPQDYNDIRTFWQHLANIYDTMIVLKKL